MDSDAIIVTITTLVFLVLLVTERASLDALGIGLIVTLSASGVVDAKTAAMGFANKAVLTIAGLYVIGEALTRTGAVDFLGRSLTRFAGSHETRILIATCVIAALFSAFLNDTAVVIVFIPILLKLGREHGIMASRLMMPLAFASLLGGMCTLVGTSTNLIVSGVAESQGAAPLGMFSLSPVGVPVAIACIAVMALTSRWLLPKRESLTVMMDQSSREYMTEMRIGKGSPLVGSPYADAFLKLGLRPLYYVRREQIFRAPLDGKVEPEDVVLLSGSIDALSNVEATMDLSVLQDLKIDPRYMGLFELAISPRSQFANRRVEEIQLHRNYGATAMAILRSGKHIHERVAEQRLHVGDLLLVCGDDESRQRLGASDDFNLLAGGTQYFRSRAKVVLTLCTVVAVITTLALGSIFHWKHLPTSVVALAGAVAVVAIRAVTPSQAYRSIDWSILIFIAGTLSLGEAMRVTGLAESCARVMIDLVQGYGMGVVVASVILLCFLFNFVISHSAVAVLFTPLAVAAAQHLSELRGWSAGSPEAEAITRAMVLAVCFGGSLCFATPIAHQVNLMVCGPGSYRYRDFLRFGLPVALVAWVVSSVGIVIVTGI